MKFLALLCLLFTASSFAQTDIDQRLQGYIKDFKLRPLTPPPAFNKKLFMFGRVLFFEKKLSGNKNISCAECHHPMTMTVDGLPLSVGEGATGIETRNGGRQQKDGKIIARNAPALFNLHNVPVMFWDGRVEKNLETGKFTTPSELPVGFASVLKNALAAQALFPLVNHEEMRGQKGTNEVANAPTDQAAWDILYKRIASVPKYKEALEELFPGEKHSIAHVARAIAHFQEQAFYAADTNYDRYLKGDLTAMTEIQKIGMDVFFGKGKCGECHRGEHLTDFSYQNVGVPQFGPGKSNGDDLGRMEIDPRPENLYAFRVPPLRNASVTAPYMHDGAFKTLAQVIEHYDDIEFSLNEYVLVNNYKNYFDDLGKVLSDTNAYKLANLSTKLSRTLSFEESEEKAIAEFIRGALTERRFLDAEIAQDYITALRIQLKEDGYQKIVKNVPSSAEIKNTTWFYFDVHTDEGYRLRELETPVKIYFVQDDNQTTLTYRKQLFKTSGSVSGVIAGGKFYDEEVVTLTPEQEDSLTTLNRDFFKRLYTYKNPTRSDDIPVMDQEVMKQDVFGMNDVWHSLTNFKHFVEVSDDMNINLEDLFFAPTSTNTKVEHLWSETINGIQAHAVLQKSRIRTEIGGEVSTYAIEIKLPKITKKKLPEALNAWLRNLVQMGVTPTDAQGTSPSPSKLTERTLQEIL